MRKKSKENGGILIISLIMLVPVTLIAITMMHECKNQWIISRNLVDNLKSELSLERTIVYFLINPHSISDSSVTAELVKSKITTCKRMDSGNSTNVISYCDEILYAFHRRITSYNVCYTKLLRLNWFSSIIRSMTSLSL